MKLYQRALLLISLLISCSAAGEILRDGKGKAVRYGGNYSAKPIDLPSYRHCSGEFRGVWVATVNNIDFPVCKTADEFKKAYRKILQNLKKAGFTAIVFQIRPCADAFYASSLHPWSGYLTGTPGRGIPQFDPMKFMVEETHRFGLEFHAWLNPFRVGLETKLGKEQYLATLPKNHFARRNPQLVLAYPIGNGKIALQLDPGSPQVRSHLFLTIRELVRNYRIDAIHFDDYFYPYHDIGSADAETFRRNNPNKLSLENWRRDNVDRIIYGIHKRLSEYNRVKGTHIRFGISPFGIWANAGNRREGSLTGGKESYSVNFADSRKWVKQQWIDYIAPQLYWHFGHPTAAYAALADWWGKQVSGTNVKLYIGLAPYRLGTDPQWNSDELANQLRYNSGNRNIAGNIWFSYGKIFAPVNARQKQGVDKALKLWRGRR